MENLIGEEDIRHLQFSPGDAVYFLTGADVRYLKRHANETIRHCRMMPLSMNAHQAVLSFDHDNVCTSYKYVDQQKHNELLDAAEFHAEKWLAELGHVVTMEGMEFAQLDQLNQYFFFSSAMYFFNVIEGLLHDNPDITAFYICRERTPLPLEYYFDSDVCAAVAQYVCARHERRLRVILMNEDHAGFPGYYHGRPFSADWVEPFVAEPDAPSPASRNIGLIPSTIFNVLKLVPEIRALGHRVTYFYSPWPPSAPNAGGSADTSRDSEEQTQLAHSIAAGLAGVWHDINEKRSKSTLPHYIIQNPFLDFQFDYIINRRWMSHAKIIQGAARYVSNHPLDVLIIPEHFTIEGAILSSLYRRTGTRIIISPHSSWPVPFASWTHENSASDLSVVWSNAARDYLRELDCRGDITNIGVQFPPPPPNPELERRLEEKRRTVGSRKIVLWITNLVEWCDGPQIDLLRHFETVRALCQVPDHLQDQVALAIRFKPSHLREEAAFYEKYCGAPPEACTLLDDLEFSECLRLADCVVGVNLQTSGYFEAFEAGKPLLHIKTTPVRRDQPDLPPEIIGQVDSIEDIWPRIEAVLFQEDRRQTLLDVQRRFVTADRASDYSGPETPFQDVLQRAIHEALFKPELSFQDLLTEIGNVAGGAKPDLLIKAYRHWIERNGSKSPSVAPAWFNLGVLLFDTADYPGAAAAYSNALALRPDLYQAAVNLGLAREQMRQPDAAIATWVTALQPDDGRLALLNHQGRVLENLGRLEEAELALRASLRTHPAQPDVIQHWVNIRQKMCLWPVLASHEVWGLSKDQLIQDCGPSVLAAVDDVDIQRNVAESFLKRKVPPAPARLSPTEGYPHDRVRIGYLSSDFRLHAMSFLVAEMLERHDRSRFEVFGYCSTKDDGSDLRKRVVASFDRFVPVLHMSDGDAARAIRDDEIDILVDLNGLTLGARLEILRWKPAPVQATYLGYIGPIPIPELDFIIADHYVIPPDLAASYQPKPLYLPNVYQANDNKRPVVPTVSRGDIGLPQDKFVFCSFSNHYKITEDVFDAWMTILQRAEQSVLWLASDNEWSDRNLRARAADRGITSERIIFTGRVQPAQYLARMTLADLYLDTFPYNAGTVASDALRMGLPMVTLSGRSFVSRMAGSLLTAVGLGRGVAHNIGQYIDLAVSLACDKRKYRAFRRPLNGDAWSRSLGNTELFTRQLEAAYESVLIRPKTGGAPPPFEEVPREHSLTGA